MLLEYQIYHGNTNILGIFHQIAFCIKELSWFFAVFCDELHIDCKAFLKKLLL